MITDGELLREYCDEGSEESFAEVVGRYVDLVYSVTLRLVGGDRHLAEDVTQRTFLALAQQADGLSARATLAGWLHITARNVAVDTVRRERRRQNREQEACIMNELPTAPDLPWEQLRPVLDEAVASLRERDRDAVVQRFFQGKSHREIGVTLGLNENAARMRVDRALDKLRGYFSRRGVTVSSALLATAITANSVQAAPAGLAASVAGASLAGAESATGSMLKILSLSMKAKLAVAAAVLITGATVITVAQQREITRLRTALASVPPAKAERNPPAPLRPVPDLTRILGEQNRLGAVEVLRQLLPVVDAVSPADMEGVLTAMKALPRTEGCKLARRLLLARWAEANPGAAVAWAAAQANDPDRADYLSVTLDTWATKDMPAALAATEHMDDPTARGAIEADLLARFAESDPRAALDTLANLPLGQRTMDLYRVVFQGWAQKDISNAAAAAMNMPASQARETAIGTVASAWGRRDPASALAWANAFPTGNTRTTAVAAAVAAWSGTDPVAAAAYFDNLPAGPMRNKLVATLAANWAAQDPKAALAWVNRVANGQVQDVAVAGILAKMSQTDPVGAAAYLAQVAVASLRDVALPQLAAAWAKLDLPAALAWVQSLPGTDAGRAQAYQNVLSNWVQTDPAGAAAYLQTIPTDPNFKALTGQLAKSWAAADPQAALVWVEALPAGDAQDNALSTVIASFIAIDPQSAWDYAAALPDDNSGSKNRTKAESMVVEIWSEQDPARAADWLATIPVGNNSGAAIATGVVAANWLKQDPAAATKWIEGLPENNARDRAIGELVRIEGKNDFPTAYRWARAIGVQGLRAPTINIIVQQWARSDPAAATAAVEADDFGAGVRKQQLLNMIKQNSPGAPSEAAPAATPTASAP